MSITDHKTNAANDAIDVLPDERDPQNGNASHAYGVYLRGQHALHIKFQHGPVKEFGFNGVTNEVLLAIVADRLRGFQSGKWACRENAIALTKIEEALHWLHARTKARAERGVEGTSKL